MSLLRSYLESNNILSAADLDVAVRHQQTQGGSLDTALLELGLLTAGELDTHLGKACGLPTVPARLLETGPVRPWNLVPKALVDIGWAMPLAAEDGNVLVAVHPDLPDARLGQLYRQIRGFMPMVAPECCLAKLAAERSGGIVAPRHAMLLLDMLDALQARDTPPGAPQLAASEPRKPTLPATAPLADLDNSFREPPADSAAATVMLPVPAPDAAESLSATIIRPTATDDPGGSGSYPIASAFSAASSGTFAAPHESGSFPVSSSGSFPDLRSVGAQSTRRSGPDARGPLAHSPGHTASERSTSSERRHAAPHRAAEPQSDAPRTSSHPASGPLPDPSEVRRARPEPAAAPVPADRSTDPARAPVPSDTPASKPDSSPEPRGRLAETRPLPAAWETRGPVARTAALGHDSHTRAPAPSDSPAAPAPSDSPAAPAASDSPRPADPAPASPAPSDSSPRAAAPADSPRSASPGLSDSQTRIPRDADPGTSLSAPVLHDPGRAERLAERMAPALAALGQARERDRITEAIVQAAIQIAPRVALFGVKREGLRALAAPGSALKLPTTLVIPIPEASLLERAILGQIRLKLLTEPRLAAAVGRPLGIPCLFEPVFAQDRGVLMLYIDRDGGLFDTADHAAARDLCDLARGSLEALLRLMGLGNSARSAAAIVDSSLTNLQSGPISAAATRSVTSGPTSAAEPRPAEPSGPATPTAPVPTSAPAPAEPIRRTTEPTRPLTSERSKPEPRERPGRASKRQVIALVNPIRRDSVPNPTAEPSQAAAAPVPSDSPARASTPTPASVLHVPNLVAPGARRTLGKKGERARSNEGMVMPTDLRRPGAPSNTPTTLSIPTSLIAPAPLPGAKRRGSKTGLHPVPPRADEITLNMPRLVRSETAGQEPSGLTPQTDADLARGPLVADATTTEPVAVPADPTEVTTTAPASATDAAIVATPSDPTSVTTDPASVTTDPMAAATAADVDADVATPPADPAAPAADLSPETATSTDLSPETAATNAPADLSPETAATTTPPADLSPETATPADLSPETATAAPADLSPETPATAPADLSPETPAPTDLSPETPAPTDLSPETPAPAPTDPASPQPASQRPTDPLPAAAPAGDVDAAIEAYLQTPDDPAALARLRALDAAGLERLAARFPGPIDPGSASDVRSFPPPSAHGPLLRACVEIGAAITPFILDLVEHPRPQIRFYAAFLFQDLRDPRCVRPLAAHAFDPDPDVRLIATRVLESYNRVPGFVESTELIRAELKSRDRERALLASEAAGTLRDTRAVPVLIELLSVRDKQLRETALESLCSITAKHHGYRPAKWKSWYAEHGQQTRIEWVLDALRHRDTAVRRWAADELIRITGHRIAPPPDGEKPSAKYILQQWTAWWQAHAAELGEH